MNFSPFGIDVRMCRVITGIIEGGARGATLDLRTLLPPVGGQNRGACTVRPHTDLATDLIAGGTHSVVMKTIWTGTISKDVEIHRRVADPVTGAEGLSLPLMRVGQPRRLLG